MFELKDIPKLFLAFFIVLPVISIIHESGHVFFAKILGGKNITIIIGSGKTIAKKWLFEIRKYYFWYGFCYFENIDENHKTKNILIYSGGTIFNIMAAQLMVYFINTEVIESGVFSYQFIYFSLYYVFFALFPMKYPDGNFSDGKIIWELLNNRFELITQKRYRLVWNEDKEVWSLYFKNEEELQSFESLEDGSNKSLETAKLNRPSRLEIIKKNKEKEVQIFPRSPL